MRLTRRIAFYEQLATLINAGVPLRTGLDRSGKRWNDPEIVQLIASLDEGSDAATAFQRAGFSSFEVKLVGAGERSGKLDSSLKQLATYWKTENDLVGAMWKNMAYPIILLHLTALLGPIPKIISCGLMGYLFSALGQLVILYAIAFAGYLIVRETWRSEGGQYFWLRAPLVGRFWRATYAYRWIIVLRMELDAGYTFSRAVPDAWEATNFTAREVRAAEAQEGLLNGMSLSALVAGWRELPESWNDYFATAEISGKIHDTLTQVEAHALAEWRTAQERLADWLPKLLYLVLILVAAAQVLNMALGVFGKIDDALGTIPQ